jgi:hypothetical protein
MRYKLTGHCKRMNQVYHIELMVYSCKAQHFHNMHLMAPQTLQIVSQNCNALISTGRIT